MGKDVGPDREVGARRDQLAAHLAAASPDVHRRDGVPLVSQRRDTQEVGRGPNGYSGLHGLVCLLQQVHGRLRPGLAHVSGVGEHEPQRHCEPGLRASVLALRARRGRQVEAPAASPRSLEMVQGHRQAGTLADRGRCLRAVRGDPGHVGGKLVDRHGPPGLVGHLRAPAAPEQRAAAQPDPRAEHGV